MAQTLPLSNAEYSAVYTNNDGVLTVSIKGDTDGTVVTWSLDRVVWIGGLKYVLTGYYGGGGEQPKTQNITADNKEQIILPNRAVNSKYVLVETKNGVQEVEIHYTGVIPIQPADPAGPAAASDPNSGVGSVLPPIDMFLVGGTPGTHTCEITALIPSGDWDVSISFNPERLMIWNMVASSKRVQWFLTWLKEPYNPNRPEAFTVTISPENHVQPNPGMIGTSQTYLIRVVYENKQ